MNKECKHPTCGSKCRRVKKQKKIYFLKRTPIKKISVKRKVSLGEEKLLTQKDWSFFLEIWSERPHECFETGEIIYEPTSANFHHVLEKGLDRYKKYRYSKWNIVIVSLQTHYKVHNMLDTCPKIKSYQQQLLKKIQND